MQAVKTQREEPIGKATDFCQELLPIRKGFPTDMPPLLPDSWQLPLSMAPDR